MNYLRDVLLGVPYFGTSSSDKITDSFRTILLEKHSLLNKRLFFPYPVKVPYNYQFLNKINRLPYVCICYDIYDDYEGQSNLDFISAQHLHHRDVYNLASNKGLYSNVFVSMKGANKRLTSPYLFDKYLLSGCTGVEQPFPDFYLIEYQMTLKNQYGQPWAGVRAWFDDKMWDFQIGSPALYIDAFDKSLPITRQRGEPHSTLEDCTQSAYNLGKLLFGWTDKHGQKVESRSEQTPI